MRYVYDPVEPVVSTEYGDVCGFTYGGIDHFLGIPYAKAERFRMPQDPDRWEGVRDAKRFGPSMLQMRPFGPGARSYGLTYPWAESEDCQNLNIWAPHSDGTGKRPVFVWMHGGGFFSGSAVGDSATDGFNMAREGDIVFVSVNHRLNLLGHLNLTDFGDDLACAKNVGIADLVAALKWIHRNIARFGGDPDDVTICGHSGGGGKVLCMYQIEEAKDCFSRGIVMSGVLDDGPETNEKDSRTLAAAMLDHMGIGRDNIEDLFTVPYSELVAGYRAVARGLKQNGVNVGLAPLEDSWFRGFPIDTGFCSWSKDKPLMLSSVLGEFNFKVRIPDETKRALDDAGKAKLLKERFGDSAQQLTELFRRAYPDHDILDLMYLDADFRRPTYETAIRKARVTSSDNTFLYMFSFNMPAECRIPAWHGADMAYAFCNTEMAPVCNDPVYGEQISNAIKNAYLNFVRRGDPGNEYLPEWKPFTDEHRYTMVIDKTNELREAYDEELIKLYKKACPPLNFSPEL